MGQILNFRKAERVFPMPRRRKSQVSPRVLEQREKQHQALVLKKQGYSLQEIAKKLGYAGRQGVHELIKSAIKELVHVPAEEERKLCLERLDSWLVKLQPKIDAGDTKAIETALKIETRRARLQGLDKAPALGPGQAPTTTNFVVLMPPQAPSIEDWQRSVSQPIDVTPTSDEEDLNV